jgi:hypothetical protein
LFKATLARDGKEYNMKQEHLEFTEQRNTGKKLVRELIKKLWGAVWDMWEHWNDI